MLRFAPNCYGGSTGWRLRARGIAPDWGSAATGRKLQTGTPAGLLKFARGLLTRDFRVAISGRNRNWPLDCAFRDIETQDSNRLPEARLWRGTRKAVAFFFVSSGGD